MVALEVETTAGSLKQQIGTQFDIRELKLTGTVDASDFEFIRDELPELVNLDLGEVSIAAYSGTPLWSGRTSWAADVLPECALMCPQLESVVLPHGVKEIADGAFGGSGVVSVVIPETVVHIGNGAFGNCNRLAEVILPVSVKTLGCGVFRNCGSLCRATVSSSLDELPENMFNGCGCLEEVLLPAGVGRIGEGAFTGCGSLARFDFPAQLVEIGDRAFFATGLQNVDLCSCPLLTRVGDWAFASIPSLTSVSFGDKLSELGTGAFFNDNALVPEPLPSSVAGLGDFAMSGIASTGGDLLADTSIENVGAYAMAGWVNAQSLVLPSTLTSLGDGAMAGWASLSHISAQQLADVPILGENVWHEVSQGDVVLVVADHLVEAFRSAPQWKEFNILPASTTSLDTILPDIASDAAKITAYIEGDHLMIGSPLPIASLMLSDINGRTYHLILTGSNTDVEVPISAWCSPILVVRITFTDGTTQGLKLSR